MFAIFSIQITVETCKKLEVPGDELYTNIGVWILCIIIPIVGWLGLAVLSIYLEVYIFIQLYNGKGEQYI